MSRQARHQLQRNDGAPKQADRSRQKGPVHHAGTMQAAGNTALTKLLDGDATSKPLPPPLQARMEQAYGTAFDSVRVHDGSEGKAAAESVQARAFTRGDDIVLGPDAPAVGSPEAEPLLAHELAHVVQQRQVPGVREGEVNRAGDAFEAAAEQAASQALLGQRAIAGGQGVAPGIQRDEKGPKDSKPAKKDEGTRDEALQALQAYLDRAKRAKPDIDLRHSDQVRSVLENFIRAGGPMVFVDIKDILKDAPNDPAEIARRIARKLPESYPRSAIEMLKKARAVDSTPSLPGRVKDLVEDTAPAKQKLPPGFFGPTLKEESDREIQMLKEFTHAPKARGFGPYSVDVLRLARIAKGLPKAIKPDKVRDPGPEPRNHPGVEEAVQSISPDALIPAEAKGTKNEDNFADAQEFAREVARQIDVAQQAGRDTASIRLGANYKKARDRAALRTAVENIIATIRAALPHHGSAVTNVDVYFGDQIITRGRNRSE